MSVIIRLQNLPWSANAADIRGFFRGLSIPEGGVHIVGGEQGDAFIAFSTDEDARQAMMNDGGKIKEVQVKLLLSSRSEMHKVIEMARQNVSFLQLAVQPSIMTSQPQAPIMPLQTANIPANVQGFLNQGLATNLPISNPLSITTTDVGTKPIDNSFDQKKSHDPKSSERKSGRSRSKSKDRDRRDKSRERSRRDRSRSRDRSRDRDRRRRERSRSRDRRDRRRDNRDRSRERDRSKDKNDRFKRRDDKKSNNFENNKLPYQQNLPQNEKFNDLPNQMNVGNIPNLMLNNITQPVPQFINSPLMQQSWVRQETPLINHMSATPIVTPQINDPRNKTGNTGEQPRASRWNSVNPDPDQLVQLQNLNERRNPNAFQGNNENKNYIPNNSILGSYPFNNSNNKFPNPRMPFQPQYRPTQNNHPASNDPRQMTNRSGKGFCVQIKNLHSPVGYSDIRKFFTGHFISNQGLKFINDDQGRRTGTVYVKFQNHLSKQEALQRSGEIIKGSSIYVAPLTEEEFNKAIDSYIPPTDNDDSKNIIIDLDDQNDEPFKVLLLKDLPNFANEHDIIRMFSDYSLLSTDMTKDGKKQYCAYVEFLNADDAKAALGNTSKHLIGHKMITVVPCTEQAYERAKALKNGEDYIEKNDNDDNGNKQSNIQPRDPRQKRFEMSDNNGRKNNWNNNPRHQSKFFPEREQHSNMRDNVMGQNNEPLDCIFMKGLPHRTTNEDIYDFFSDVSVAPTKTHLMLTMQGQPSGDCFCEFANVDEAKAALSKNGAMIGPNSVSIDIIPRSVVMGALSKLPPENSFGPPMRGNFRGRGGFRGRGRGGRGMFNPNFRGGPPMGGRFPPPNNEPYVSNNPPDFGSPGCVLALENVPFWSSVPEIIEFFNGFELNEVDVIRRFDDNGSPTGDVRVRFKSHFDAKKAQQQCNNKTMRNRMITISIV